MSIKKVTLASLILLSLTACSSGSGSGSSSNNTEAKAKPPVHQPSSQNNSSDAKKADADRVAKEKAEAERLKKEEADRLAKEKAEAERLKKEEADRLAKEKAEAERLKKEEADRLAKEKAEAERLKKEEADRLAKEKAENERKLNEIREEALKAGYSDQEATDFAKNNLTDSEYSYMANLQDAKSRQVKEIIIALGFSEQVAESMAYQFDDIRELKKFQDPEKVEEFIKTEKGSELLKASKNLRYETYPEGRITRGEEYTRAKATYATDYILQGSQTDRKDVYNQKYSVVVGDYSYFTGSYNGIPVVDSSYNLEVSGLRSKLENIPKEGQATYRGKAFSSHNEGELTYNIDFGSRLGSGRIDNLPDISDVRYSIVLDEATMKQTGLSGQANSSNGDLGTYSLELFGPKAEEISGSVELDKSGVIEKYGLAGTRGEIAK